MDETVKRAIVKAVKKEPFAQALKMKLVELEDGYSVVKMRYDPDTMDNIYSRAHGGAVFGLIDEAFETAGQTDGTIAVALNVNITYIASPQSGAELKAEARRVSQTKKTAVYELKVTDQNDILI
ncbi:MAG: hotdog fold thioesterase, partial [Desulfobacterales bacterium]